MWCAAAKSSVDDLRTGLGVVSCRAPTIVRSVETHPLTGRFVVLRTTLFQPFFFIIFIYSCVLISCLWKVLDTQKQSFFYLQTSSLLCSVKLFSFNVFLFLCSKIETLKTQLKLVYEICVYFCFFHLHLFLRSKNKTSLSNTFLPYSVDPVFQSSKLLCILCFKIFNFKKTLACDVQVQKYEVEGTHLASMRKTVEHPPYCNLFVCSYSKSCKQM